MCRKTQTELSSYSLTEYWKRKEYLDLYSVPNGPPLFNMMDNVTVSYEPDKKLSLLVMDTTESLVPLDFTKS